jgi:hypothetical protein
MNIKKNKWVGVDLDGTLAEDMPGAPHDDFYIGPPISRMVERIKQWRAEGIEVRILTARAGHRRNIIYIEKWCQEHLGEILPVTDKKDYDMAVLYDDRAIGIERNTGIELAENARNAGFEAGYQACLNRMTDTKPLTDDQKEELRYYHGGYGRDTTKT